MQLGVNLVGRSQCHNNIDDDRSTRLLSSTIGTDPKARSALLCVTIGFLGIGYVTVRLLSL